MDVRDAMPICKQNDKPGPSGMSRNDAFKLPEKWQGRNFLVPVDVGVEREIKIAMGSDAMLDFVPPGFAAREEEVYASLGIYSPFGMFSMRFCL